MHLLRFHAETIHARVCKTVVFMLLTVLAFRPIVTLAQDQNSGAVTGGVTDSSGAVVTTATATITSVAQGTTSTTRVNQRGEFNFLNVKPGDYILSISAPTFSTFTTSGTAVNAGQTVRIDARLSPGSESVTLTVDAPSATVDTRSATIATVIDPGLVQGLPVDGANVVALAALLPGVTNVNAPTTFTSDTGGPTYNVSGSRSNQNLLLLDGGLWNNVYYNTGLNYPPPFMLQEVSVQLNNFKAQYGRNVGSIFNVLTKSGTNTIHGDVWDYVNNRAFNAADYISHHNPQLVSNQYGATVGGPLRHDRLFYFLGFQILHADTEIDSKSETPTLAERGFNAPGVPRPCVSSQFAGMTCASFAQDFAGNATENSLFLANKAGVQLPTTVYAFSALNSTYAVQGGTGTSPCVALINTLAAATATKTYFPNGEIPSICFNPVIVNLMNQYLPLPNDPNGAGLPYTLTYTSAPRRDYQGFARFDWNLGRHTIDGRTFETNPSSVIANGYTDNLAQSSYEPDNNISSIRSGNIGDTWVIKPNLLNIARVAYKRFTSTIIPTDPTTLATLGAIFPTVGTPVLPQIQVTNRFNLGNGGSSAAYSLNTSFELDESVTWTKSNHNFAFGAQYMNLNYIQRKDYENNFQSSPTNTSVSLSDFVLGLIATENVGNRSNISATQHDFYFYAQDDWRATSRLTMNLGLRYELPFPWYQPDGQSVTFIPGYQSYKFPNVPPGLAYQNDPGVPGSIIKATFSGLAPRVGLAYDVSGNGKTAIRAAFGLFYDAINANTVGIGQPYFYLANYSFPTGSYSEPLLDDPAIVPAYTTPASAQFAPVGSVNFADANLTLPYTEAVNFGIQQHIAKATLELNYVGKFGRHEIVPYDTNPSIYDCSGSYYQANPGLYCPSSPAAVGSYQARVRYPGYSAGGQGVVDNNTVGTSNYNGLQVIYTQRSRNSLTTTASYTYSRSLDDQSNGTTNSAQVPYGPNVNTNYGPSDFQATHVVNLGWVYNLPAPKSPAWESAVLSNWTFGGIFNARTGNPINVTVSGDINGTDESPQRPPLATGLTSYVPLPSNRSRAEKVQEWFNVASFNANPQYALAAQGQLTHISRNFLYAPAFIETDLNVARKFPLHITKSTVLEIRADAFNAWNTPNLGPPVSSLATSATSATFQNAGEILTTVGKNPFSNSNGRRIQLVAILHY